ncbi:MAG: hypothetical protein KAJ01_01400 [Candidatus Hydrogenedentes bacterium]|nr:hypothetical protein [Candidatus Hydrogenedentota bacterium]
MPPDRIVRADESAIGSTVTRDVKDDKGAVVCFAGDRLSVSLLLKFKRAGISSVYVEREPSSHKRGSLDERLCELDRKFAGVETNPAMRVLKEIIAERTRENAGGGT